MWIASCHSRIWKMYRYCIAGAITLYNWCAQEIHFKFDFFVDAIGVYYIFTIWNPRLMLKKYLYSRENINLFGITFLNNFCLFFVQKHVLMHENYFLYYNCYNTRHYGKIQQHPTWRYKLRVETSFCLYPS